jgi:4-hydroxy-3-methylbut-2-enyl diphosphate reductase
LELLSNKEIQYFDIHKKETNTRIEFLPPKETITIAITSGASCPDSIMDKVIHRILELLEIQISLEDVLVK